MESTLAADSCLHNYVVDIYKFTFITYMYTEFLLINYPYIHVFVTYVDDCGELFFLNPEDPYEKIRDPDRFLKTSTHSRRIWITSWKLFPIHTEQYDA